MSTDKRLPLPAMPANSGQFAAQGHGLPEEDEHHVGSGWLLLGVDAGKLEVYGRHGADAEFSPITLGGQGRTRGGTGSDGACRMAR